MGTKQFDSYADLITFTRASSGTALRRVGYGSELVTNGAFDTDTTGWTATSGATLSVVSGRLNVFTTAPDTFSVAYQEITVEAGKVYEFKATKLSQDFNSAWGISTAIAGARDVLNLDNTSTGTQTAVFVASSATLYIQLWSFSNGAVNATAVYDNISVKEVIFDRATDPLVLFDHPANTPRIEYDADGNRLGLLIEEARTNLVAYSDLSGNWTGSNLVISANSETGIDGLSSAATLIETTATGLHQIQDILITGSESATYTASCIVKILDGSADRDFVLYVFEDTTVVDSFSAEFDTSDWSITATMASAGAQVDGASIKPMGNGKYRVSVTGIPKVGSANSNLRFTFRAKNPVTNSVNYLGDGVSGFVVEAMQLELGSFPTSYIPTSGAAATRAADAASIPTSAFGYNQTAGTVIADFQFLATEVASKVNILYRLRSFSANSSIYLQENGSGQIRMIFVNNTVTEGNLFGISGAEAFTQYKVANAFKTNDLANLVSGGVLATDTLADMPNDIVQLDLGVAGFSNVIIKSIQYFPRRLSNQQLVDLTS